MTNTFRLLKPTEINARVNQVFQTEKWTGVSILLYKDARVDMALLDEVYGPLNWQVTYHTIGASLYCQIDIWDDAKGMWVGKMSNGTESNMEAEKGQASDAFKRAGFMVGIGRELYTAPDILVTLDPSEVYTDKKTGKPKTNVRFIVDDIGYNENRCISYLVLSKELKGKREVCVTWGTKPKAEPKSEPKPEEEKVVIGIPDTTPSAGPDDWKLYYTELKKLCPDEERLKEVCKANGVDSAKKLNQFYFNALRNILKNA